MDLVCTWIRIMLIITSAKSLLQMYSIVTVVWTNNNIFVESVLPDTGLWEQSLPKVIDFCQNCWANGLQTLMVNCVQTSLSQPQMIMKMSVGVIAILTLRTAQ